MKIIQIIVLLIGTLLFAVLSTTIGCSSAKWTNKEKINQCAFVALHVVDWQQTREIASNPDEYEERMASLIIGKHPSKQSVDIWAAGVLGCHFLISDMLGENKKYWQWLTISLKTCAVTNNLYIGLKGTW